ncbi:MAG: recombinase family protein [Gordonia sp. (in: high G+C Gram-positive bacteria)]
MIRPGDVVIVYSISRVSRSPRDLLRLVDRLRDQGVGIRSLTEPIDTTSTSPHGEFTLTLLASLAELERNILRERYRSQGRCEP